MPYEVGVAVQMDDVVKVTGATAFGEGSQLLAEQFRNWIGDRATHWQWLVAVVVPDRPQCRGLGQHFVGGDVELDLGRYTAGLVRTPVGDPSLCGRVAAAVSSALECSGIEEQFDARFLTQPLRYLCEDPL